VTGREVGERAETGSAISFYQLVRTAA